MKDPYAGDAMKHLTNVVLHSAFSKVEKSLQLLGHDRLMFVSLKSLTTWLQARQRKGKVPNNPPEIDVDLPVLASECLESVQSRRFLVSTFNTSVTQ